MDFNYKRSLLLDTNISIEWKTFYYSPNKQVSDGFYGVLVSKDALIRLEYSVFLASFFVRIKKKKIDPFSFESFYTFLKRLSELTVIMNLNQILRLIEIVSSFNRIN